MAKTIQEAFEDYHAAHPEVYAWLVRQARRAKERGHAKIGIELLFAVLRWERMMGKPDPSQTTFKINDHYTSRYARLIMGCEADLVGFFETRQLTSHGPSALYEAVPASVLTVGAPSMYDPFA